MKMLPTTPITRTEANRCSLILEGIKAFHRSTTEKERLTDLIVISIENTIMTEMENGNEEVINHLIASKSLQSNFVFKYLTSLY